MPDTGSPHFVPFLDGTELVRAYPAFSEDLADAVAAGLSAAGSEGIGPNVVQTVKTDTFTTSSSTFSTVTGLTAIITPSSATSKILVVAYVNISNTATGTGGGGTVVRIAGGNSGNFIGDAAGTRQRVAYGTTSISGFPSTNTIFSAAIFYLDSPATATATTYSVQMAATFGTAYLNRSGVDSNNSRWFRTASSITAIEVAP
jgi:hypothetical protein